MTRKLLLPFVLVGLVFVFGCGSGKQSLSGTVTFLDDGSPVPMGTVQFDTTGSFSRGEIKSDGTYVVGTDTLTDGIPKGTYTVTVHATEYTEIRGADGSASSTSKQLINPKYNSAETSGLTFTADGKTKKFDIQVERAR